MAMTHDELLTKLWILPADVSELQHGAKAVQALRAVLELHKPVEGNEHLCSSCLFGDFLQAYPCITIQTIEKELG